MKRIAPALILLAIASLLSAQQVGIRIGIPSAVSRGGYPRANRIAEWFPGGPNVALNTGLSAMASDGNFLSYSTVLNDVPWYSSGSAVITASQTDPMGGTGAFRIDGPTADVSGIRQSPVAVSIAPSQSAVLSFWIKGASASTAVRARYYDGAVYVVTSDFSVSTSWEYKTIAIVASGSATASQTVYFLAHENNATFYLFQTSLTPGTSGIYQATGSKQTVYDPLSGLSLQLGSSASSDTNDPIPAIVSNRVIGHRFTTDDYEVSGNLSGLSMAGSWTVYFGGLLDGSSGSVFSIASAAAANQYISVRYSASGSVIIAAQAGGSETTSDALSVSTSLYSLFALTSNGTTLTLTRLDTGTSVTLANPGATGTPRVGLGARVASTVTNQANAMTAFSFVLFSAVHGPGTQQSVRRYLKTQMSNLRGLTVQ